jgi:hypothetical protein
LSTISLVRTSFVYGLPPAGGSRKSNSGSIARLVLAHSRPSGKSQQLYRLADAVNCGDDVIYRLYWPSRTGQADLNTNSNNQTKDPVTSESTMTSTLFPLDSILNLTLRLVDTLEFSRQDQDRPGKTKRKKSRPRPSRNRHPSSRLKNLCKSTLHLRTNPRSKPLKIPVPLSQTLRILFPPDRPSLVKRDKHRMARTVVAYSRLRVPILRAPEPQPSTKDGKKKGSEISPRGVWTIPRPIKLNKSILTVKVEVEKGNKFKLRRNRRKQPLVLHPNSMRSRRELMFLRLPLVLTTRQNKHRP